MPLFKATPARRRNVMIALLVLATGGALVRHFAPAPSTLRDIGTLLLVLWLPAVGNLVAYLLRRIPRKAPQAADFDDSLAFVPHLQVSLQPVAPAAIPDSDAHRCILVVGRRGFTARLQQPVGRIFAVPTDSVPLQLLQPSLALRELKPGVDFHLLVGTAAVASGVVLTQTGSGPTPVPTP